MRLLELTYAHTLGPSKIYSANPMPTRPTRG